TVMPKLFGTYCAVWATPVNQVSTAPITHATMQPAHDELCGILAQKGGGEAAGHRLTWVNGTPNAGQSTFPEPWTVEQIPGVYKVLDAHGQSLTSTGVRPKPMLT